MWRQEILTLIGGHISPADGIHCEHMSNEKLKLHGKPKDFCQWIDLPEIVESDGMEVIDYDLLIKQFGSGKVDDALLEQFKKVTGHMPHYFLRRRIAFSHRNVEAILDKHEKKEPFFIYAGRGPSSESMHLGHMVNFTLAKWLSDAFEVPLLVMLSDGK
jgi:tryptophanyl-tRNA synthetase